MLRSEHLQRVRIDGDWEGWLTFFLQGVIDVAESTTRTTQRLVAMIESDLSCPRQHRAEVGCFTSMHRLVKFHIVRAWLCTGLG